MRRKQKYAGDGMANGLREDPKVFIAIAEDGTVTVLCHRSEMGQGVRTSWPLVVADELEADWAKMKVAQAQGDEPKFGNQDTDGSRSMRHHFMTLRRMGAAARQMLEQAAATQWGVPVTEVEAVNHEVVHKGSDRALGYGELAKAAADLPVPARDSLKLKDPAKFRYIGKGETPPDRRLRHHHRQGDVRHRCQARRHGVRRRRAPAGARRQGASRSTMPRR